MENHIKTIELINKFLDKSLSENEMKYFENRLITDIVFKEAYESQEIFLQGLKRHDLKREIKKAKRFYKLSRWFKYLGFTSLALVVLVFVYLNLNSPTRPITIELPKEKNNSKVILDSIIHHKSLEEKLVNQDTLKVEETERKTKIFKKEITNKEKLVEIKIPTKLSQKFILNSQKDTIVICQEGTKLIVEANSFVDASNNLVEGNVDITVTEYYKLSDMLLANLSTQSNGNLLETGGMLFIEAKKGKDDLKLKENSNIGLLFSKKDINDDMQLFSGEWKDEIINWRPFTSQDIIIEEHAISFLSDRKRLGSDVLVPFALVEEPPVFPGCENIAKAERRKCSSEAISSFIKTNFNKSIAQNITETGRHDLYMQFVINKEGLVVDIQATASHIKLAQEGIRVLEAMPKIKAGKQRNEMVSVVHSFRMSFGDVNSLNKNNRNSIRLKSRTTSDSKPEEKLIAIENLSASSETVANNVFSTARLGWINSDHFRRGNSNIKFKLKSKREDGAKVSMVFKSFDAILPSRYLENGYEFGNIPADEDVVIVAIKKNEDKLYIDIIDTKTEANPNIEFDFEQVSLEKLKSELGKLNLLFSQ